MLKKQIQISRSFSAGYSTCSAAQRGASCGHSEEFRKRIDTAMRADEELEARAAKAEITRNVHQDAAKKSAVMCDEERGGTLQVWKWQFPTKGPVDIQGCSNL